jgi:hypothetical protein
MHDHARFRPEWAERLNNPHRLETQVSDAELARLLALTGHEDLIDLGSGTGFYTDRIAALTTGTVGGGPVGDCRVASQARAA